MSAGTTPRNSSPGSRRRPESPTGCRPKPNGNMPRAGAQATPFWWGKEVGTGRAQCADCGERDRQAGGRGLVPPNAFGLYDTAGNAAEWVEDCWNPSYRGAPNDGSAWTSGDCSLRVLRGGSFADKAHAVQSSARFRYDEDVRYYANGFRVAQRPELTFAGHHGNVFFVRSHKLEAPRGTAGLADERPCQVRGRSRVCARAHPGDADGGPCRAADRARHRQRQIRERGRPGESGQRRQRDQRPAEESGIRRCRSAPQSRRRRVQAGGSRIRRPGGERRCRRRLLFRTWFGISAA